VRSEGFYVNEKFQWHQLGSKPTTFRFVAQHFNHYRGPPYAYKLSLFLIHSHSYISTVLQQVKWKQLVQLENVYSQTEMCHMGVFNPLTPNDRYTSRTAPITSKLCILYIYSTNIRTEYFKHSKYSPFSSSSKFSVFHNSNVFDSCIIHILYIYSTNICTEYFKHGIFPPSFLFKMLFVS